MVTKYRKLWHLLLDQNIKKTGLQKQAGVCLVAINKLTLDENISTEVLCHVRSALRCKIGSIIDFAGEAMQDTNVEVLLNGVTR